MGDPFATGSGSGSLPPLLRASSRRELSLSRSATVLALPWSSRVRRLVSPPVFLTIRWELPDRKKGSAEVMEATLCLAHRQEVALRYPSAWGCGQFGNSCDFC